MTDENILDLVMHDEDVRKESRVGLAEYRQKSLATQALYGEYLLSIQPAMKKLIKVMGEESMEANDKLEVVTEEKNYLLKKVKEIDYDYLNKMSEEIKRIKYSNEEREQKLRQRIEKRIKESPQES